MSAHTSDLSPDFVPDLAESRRVHSWNLRVRFFHLFWLI
jgi:hypothetical protein